MISCAAATWITWLLRRGAVGDTFGGGAADQLPARGALGLRAKAAVDAGRIRVVTGFRPDLSCFRSCVSSGVVSAPRVVFVCTHNSARSQLAAALWGRRSQVPAASAGTEPARRVHPLAVAAAREHGLSLGRTAHVGEVLRPDDLVVAVCDNAHEALTVERLHWSVPDPASAGTEEAFHRAFTDLADRVDRLAPTVHSSGSQR